MLCNGMKEVWLRHRGGGGGRIFGNDAEVSRDCFIDRDSSVGDRAQIHNSQVIRSTIADDAIIVNAQICDSYVHDNTKILGYNTGALVSGCDLAGVTRIWDSPILQDVMLNGVTVFGTAQLVGPWELNAAVRIHAGAWAQPPRWRLIKGENIEVVISECVEDRFHIGCWCLDYDTWTRPNYRQRIGKRSGWTPEQVEETYQWFTRWLTSKR